MTETDGGNWVWKNLWVAFEEMHEEMVKRLVIDWHDDIVMYMTTYTRPFLPVHKEAAKGVLERVVVEQSIFGMDAAKKEDCLRLCSTHCVFIR